MKIKHTSLVVALLAGISFATCQITYNPVQSILKSVQDAQTEKAAFEEIHERTRSLHLSFKNRAGDRIDISQPNWMETADVVIFHFKDGETVQHIIRSPENIPILLRE